MGTVIMKKKLIFAAIALATLTSTANAQDSRNRWVEFHNTTGTTAYWLYATNTADQDWGDDWLGADVIRPDQTYSLDVNDGTGACRFDIKVVYANQAEQTLMDVNVCAISHIDLLPGGLEVAY
jgi:hypothetical protein